MLGLGYFIFKFEEDQELFNEYLEQINQETINDNIKMPDRLISVDYNKNKIEIDLFSSNRCLN